MTSTTDTAGRWCSLIVSWLLYNMCWLVLLFWPTDYRTVMAVGFILQSVVMLVALIALFRPFRRNPPPFSPPPSHRTAKMVSLLLAGLFAATSLKAQDVTPPPSSSEPKCIAICIGAGIIIGIGAGGAYVIWRLCHLLPPPAPPPPKPPAPPPPPPPGTNAPPTNVTSRALSKTLSTSALQLLWTVTNATPLIYDISSFDYADTNANADGTVYYTGLLCEDNLQTSVDLKNWQLFSLRAYISANGVLTAIYDGTNVIYATYTPGDVFNSATVGMETALPNTNWSSQQQYFRYIGGSLTPTSP